MNTLQKLESTLLKPQIPSLKIGQSVRVSLKIVEGEKSRIQVYEGVVIGMKGGGHRQTFTVRKVSYGVGVERIFPFHSPAIQKVEVVREGDVSRAKLYYLRDRSGRSARLSEKKREIVSAKGTTPVLSVPSVTTPKVEAKEAAVVAS
ncbi:MAG: 50S ribosomal protein L19 [Nitrospirota bacterium]